MWSSTILGILSAVGVVYTEVTVKGMEWWEILLIALVPPVIGLVGDILVNKGIITKEQNDAIQKKTGDVADDLKDDGELNNSNKDKED